MPEEEGKEIINHTVGVQGIPIYMGNETQCINIIFQIWLFIVYTTWDFYNKF